MNLDSDPISDQSAAASRPLLSITMPTKDRPHLLSRALASVGRAVGPEADRVELTVSDGSGDDASAQAVKLFLARWAGRHRYIHNHPPLPLVDNMNRAIELASGTWIMQLGDDDHLLPGAVAAMLEAIGSARPEEAVMLFGVDIVNADGVRSRTQHSGASNTSSRRRHWSGCCATPRSFASQRSSCAVLPWNARACSIPVLVELRTPTCG